MQAHAFEASVAQYERRPIYKAVKHFVQVLPSVGISLTPSYYAVEIGGTPSFEITHLVDPSTPTRSTRSSNLKPSRLLSSRKGDHER